MVRTQIQLDEDQARRLRALAARRGVSIARLVREALDAHLRGGAVEDPAERRRRALTVIGRFRSGRHDVARRHDAYLAEDLGR